MNEQEKYEKVIKGLGSCVEYFASKVKGVMFDEWLEESSKAIALLKVQEPHLITKADFADNPMIDDGGYLPAWVEFNREKYGDFFEEEDADGWGCVNIYKVGNDMARYWTAKPSLKQMEETPWE